MSRRRGRPTDYNEDVASLICSEMASGRSLLSICSDAGMPDKATVFRWLARYPDFRDNYTRAQDDRASALAEEILEIADDTTAEDVQRAKLRVDTRKWLMSKMAPKRYGDKQEVEHTGQIITIAKDAADL